MLACGGVPYASSIVLRDTREGSKRLIANRGGVKIVCEATHIRRPSCVNIFIKIVYYYTIAFASSLQLTLLCIHV